LRWNWHPTRLPKIFFYHNQKRASFPRAKYQTITIKIIPLKNKNESI
jgi:hypothetical protein